MELITILGTLAAQCTLKKISELITTITLEKSTEQIITKSTPNYISKILSEFKDLQLPINDDLKKAILKAHWQATQFLCEQLLEEATKNHKPIDVYLKVVNISKEQLKYLEKNKLQNPSRNSIDVETPIIDNITEDATNAREASIKFHLLLIRELVGRTSELPEYETFENIMRNGYEVKNITWTKLVSLFFTELLKGDNNRAKDAFQNEELVKIGVLVNNANFGIEKLKNMSASIKEDIEDKLNINFDSLTERFNQELTDIKLIASSTMEAVENLSVAFSKIQFSTFPDYERIKKEIDSLETDINNKNNEKSEIDLLLLDAPSDTQRVYFEKQLKIIDAELIKLSTTKSEREAEIRNLKDYIEKTWEILYSDSTPTSFRLAQAKKLFEEGKLSEANALLDSEDLMNDYNNIIKARYKIQDRENSLSYDFLAKASFTVLEKSNENWHEEAKQYYKNAISLKETYESYFSFAYFLQFQNEIYEAESMYILMLSYANNNNEKAIGLTNLGSIQKVLNKLHDAEINFKEALKIRLSEESSTENSIRIAEALNNLAILQNQQNIFDESEKNFKKALDIYQSLEDKLQSQYIYHIGTLFNNIGNLERILKKFNSAKENLLNALHIRRSLAEDNSEKNLEDVATTLNNLSAYYVDTNEFDTAENHLSEALKIRKMLAIKNPKSYLPNIGMTLTNLGNVQKSNNKLHAAHLSFTEALEIYNTLVDLYPQAYKFYVANLLNSIGLNYAEEEKLNEAVKYYKDALDMFTELSNQSPELYKNYLATVLLNWGNLEKKRENYDLAKDYYERALSINTELSLKNPNIYSSSIALNLNNLGNLHKQLGKLEEAEEYYYKSLSISRELSETYPNVYNSDVARTLTNLGNIQSEKNNIKGAEDSFDEAINIYKKLSQISPNIYELYLAESYNKYAYIYVNKSNTKDKKNKSLMLASFAFQKASPYLTIAQKARIICDNAQLIWQMWNENLSLHLLKTER